MTHHAYTFCLYRAARALSVDGGALVTPNTKHGHSLVNGFVVIRRRAAVGVSFFRYSFFCLTAKKEHFAQEIVAKPLVRFHICKSWFT